MRNDDDSAEDKAVTSTHRDTKDGRQVTIQQQNVGSGNQLGGGEFKNVGHVRSVDGAVEEQAGLETEAPTPDN